MTLPPQPCRKFERYVTWDDRARTRVFFAACAPRKPGHARYPMGLWFEEIDAGRSNVLAITGDLVGIQVCCVQNEHDDTRWHYHTDDQP